MTLCYKLAGVKLGNNSLENLVTDGRKNLVIKILTKLLVEVW